MTAEIETKVFGEDKFTVEDIGNIIGTLTDSEYLVVESASGKTEIHKDADSYFVKMYGFKVLYFKTFRVESKMDGGQSFKELKFYSDKDEDDFVGFLNLNIKDIRDIYIQDVE